MMRLSNFCFKTACALSLFLLPDEEADRLGKENEHHTEAPSCHLHKEQRKFHFLPHQVRISNIKRRRGQFCSHSFTSCLSCILKMFTWSIFWHAYWWLCLVQVETQKVKVSEFSSQPQRKWPSSAVYLENAWMSPGSGCSNMDRLIGVKCCALPQDGTLVKPQQQAPASWLGSSDG